MRRWLLLFALLASCAGARSYTPVPAPRVELPSPWISATTTTGVPGERLFADRAVALALPALNSGHVRNLHIVLLSPTRTEFIGLGASSPDHPEAPIASSIFEIGSLTKIFTGLALAALESQGLKLDTPASEILGWTVPAKGRAQSVSLVDLATHTSGLPSMPDGYVPKDFLEPFAQFTPDGFPLLVERTKPLTKPGAKYRYSNLGFGILGLVVAKQKGDYDSSLRSLVLEPFGLDATGSEQKPTVLGHDADGNTMPSWKLTEPFKGAGALRSSPQDLARLLRAFLAKGTALSPLTEASARVRKALPKGTITPISTALPERIRRQKPLVEMGLGWHIVGSLRVMTGRTGGFHSYLAFDPDRQMGVVLLSGSATLLVDKLGAEMVNLLSGQPATPVTPRETVPLANLEAYVGGYEVGPGYVLDVALGPTGLTLQAPHQPPLGIYAESASSFFLRGIQAKVDFILDPTGAPKGLVLKQAGKTFRARKR